jgi:hypothetical protein
MTDKIPDLTPYSSVPRFGFQYIDQTRPNKAMISGTPITTLCDSNEDSFDHVQN